MSIKDLATHSARYVTVAQLAEYWAVSRRQILKRIESGARDLPKGEPGEFVGEVHDLFSAGGSVVEGGHRSRLSACLMAFQRIAGQWSWVCRP